MADQHTRYLLACHGLRSTKGDGGWPVFERLFRQYGLPRAIRTDNGVPFATQGLHGLSQLNVRWLRLGIQHQRILPAHPQQNGAHERIHKTLKREATRPPRAQLQAQQRAFNAFRRLYNDERPHESLHDRPPAALYHRSPRPYPAVLPPLWRPTMTRLVTLALLLCSITPALAADGVFTFRERYCLSVDGQRQCSRGHEDFMFLGSVAYYRPDADSYWTEIGTVGGGKTIVLTVSRDGIGRLVAARAGVDVSDAITQFTFTYKGRVQGKRIVNGHAHVDLTIDLYGETHRIRGNVSFTGKRIGDAYPVPPPDPYYFGEMRSAPRHAGEPAAFTAVRRATGKLIGWSGE